MDVSNPLLTTITPWWGRLDMLSVWLRSILRAGHPSVCHLLLCAGPVPAWVHEYECESILIRQVTAFDGSQSIGHYHNIGAELSQTDWIMKMDVDCIAHVQFFNDLLVLLKDAPVRAWFNCGMYYIDRFGSFSKLTPSRMPLTTADFYSLVSEYSKYPFPAGTNFICRRKDYLELGGCDRRFRGWGWEDYQQIYMLESHQLECDPFGLTYLGDTPVNEANVTNLCRDIISRRKARELVDFNDRLALLHRWHETENRGNYKTPKNTAHNRRVLLDYIQKRRTVHA